MRRTASFASFVLLASMFSCSGKDAPKKNADGDGDASGGVPGDGDLGGDGDASGGSGGSSTSNTGGTDPGFETGPIRPRRYRVPDPDFLVPPCENGGDGSVISHEVLVGQTHLTPDAWPFQTVSANRPLTIAVAATGTGTAPAMTATARLDGGELSICLVGPSALPADTTELETATYRGTLPADWVKPGLEIDVLTGVGTETLTPRVVAENGLTLYVVEAELFEVGQNDPTSDQQWTELLARLPFSYLDVGVNPFGVWRPTKLLLGPRDDGRTPTGETTSHEAIFVDENPHCSSDDQADGTCTPHSGFGTMAGVLQALDTFREANGAHQNSTWYAVLGQALGGGLAGGQRGTGDGTGLVMNHELGHAWGFPHWGSSHTDYPYEGVQRDRGGFGDRWGIDQVTGLLLSSQCDDLERQSPMQRAGSCVPDGSWYDVFSDYESARLLRMNLGAAEEITGEIPYSGGVLDALTRPYVLPSEGGRDHLSWNEDAPGFSLTRYDEGSNTFMPHEPDSWNRVVEAEVPVVMFSGAVIRSGEAHFEEPISYFGNVLDHLDPSDPDDYETLYEKRTSEFYWAKDLHLRFTLESGEVFTRIYGGEAVLRVAGDHARFAFNLPGSLGGAVAKVEILARPLGHYSEDSRLDETVNATNYYDAAEVLGTWER